MLHTKPQGHRLFDSGQEYFKGCYHICDGPVLVMLPSCGEQTLALTGPVILEKTVEECGGRMDDRRSLPKGSGDLITEKSLYFSVGYIH